MSFVEGLTSGVMGMFGCGSFYDPMSQYEQQLAAAQSKLNSTVQQGTLQMAVESEKSQAQMLALLGVFNDHFTFQSTFDQSVASFASKENQTAIILLGVILLIVIVYIIIAPTA